MPVATRRNRHAASSCQKRDRWRITLDGTPYVLHPRARAMPSRAPNRSHCDIFDREAAASAHQA
ncbi:hypothetical protein BURCENBC7_AP4382 [Burkholderia cenocepacia BC7]|nr:uncharacterized protein BCN122_II3256 [Burkholderia cenocepacia]EPZ88234.1 hypothetical protein BURCENK562V_C5055 [Burkholderia cenocepacia K56-2Valvano]ERI28358.1 hypothetical protein BURCENBC7_AP4382 [Burkholderia cenocepacia BC7]